MTKRVPGGPGEPIDHAELLARCRRGDQLAWEALVRRNQARVYGLALHYVRDAEEARDLAQEVFVRIYTKLGSLPDDGIFLPWLLRLTRNICIDHLRRRKVRPVPAARRVEEPGPDPVDPGPTPEQAWVAGDRRRLVHRALQRLSDVNREIIMLKEIQGLKLEEIAALLDLPLGTVKSRSNRARVELARAVIALSGSGI